MKRLFPLFSALLMAIPAFAQDSTNLGAPLGAEAFDARTVGRTITYLSEGLPYGVEQYLPGRKVLWAFAEGACKEGTWFQAGDQICFDYQDENGLQCWAFYDTKDGLVASFEGRTDLAPLVSLRESPEPLACEGPDIGV